jgi:hypothetical protein
MREKYVGLVREYSTLVRERDRCEELVRAAPEGIEREEASRKLALIDKRCAALRREIRRYPDVHTLAPTSAPNDPARRYTALAR